MIDISEVNRFKDKDNPSGIHLVNREKIGYWDKVFEGSYKDGYFSIRWESIHQFFIDI